MNRAFQMIVTAYCYIGGTLPLTWLLASWGIYIRYKLTFGVWPKSDLELSNSFPLHDMLITEAVVVLPVFFFGWFFSSAVFCLTSPTYLPFPRFLYLFAIWPATLIFIFIDPGGFMHGYFFGFD
jgi:hypothetical protein